MTIRVFHDLQARVGNQGRYQCLLVAYLSVLIVPAVSSYFASPFLFHQNAFACTDRTVQDCNHYVCSLPPQEQRKYIDESFTSLVSRFGNYRCEGQEDITFAETIIYLGGLLGTLLGAVLMKCFTHRKTLLIGIITSIIGQTLVLLSPNLSIACAGLFLNLIGASIVLQIYVPYITQTSSQQFRLKGIFVTVLVFSFGAAMVAGVFWLIQPWYLAFILLLLLPNLVVLIFWFVFLEQTPFQMVTQNQSSQSFAYFQRIAHLNGVECDITEAELVAIRNEYDENQKNKRESQSISPFDLCRYDSLKFLFSICILIRFTTSFTFYGPSLVLKDFTGSIYLNGIFLGIAQVLAGFASLSMIDKFPRKPLMIAFSTLCAAVSLPLFLFFSCSQDKDCPSSQQIFQVIGLFLVRFMMTMSFTFYFVLINEVFPSQIRVMAVQFLAFSGKLAIMSVPYIQHLFDKAELSVILAFFIAAALNAVMGCFLPETFGTAPPQMIQELEYEHEQEQ